MPFTIQDLQDLLRLLGEHPEWQGALRQHVLSAELLAVPDILARVVENQLHADVLMANVVERLSTLAEAQVRTEEALRTVTDHMDQLAGGLQRVRQELGSLSELVGASVELEAERTLVALLAEHDYQLLAAPSPMAVDGEVDVAVPVRDAEGREFWVLVEAKARLHRSDVRNWDRRLHDTDLIARLQAEGVIAPFLPYVFGLRVYRGADEQGRASGIGILGPLGERVPAIPRQA